MASDAVMTTIPRPVNWSLTPAVSAAARRVIPELKAPAKQQSRNSAMRSDRQRSIRRFTQLASIPGRHQAIELRIRRGEEQLPVVVLETVARDTDEEKVVPRPVREERLQRLADRMGPCVEECLDIEPADVLRPKDALQRRRVLRRSRERRQARVRIRACRNDQRAAPGSHVIPPVRVSAAGGAPSTPR